MIANEFEYEATRQAAARFEEALATDDSAVAHLDPRSATSYAGPLKANSANYKHS